MIDARVTQMYGYDLHVRSSQSEVYVQKSTARFSSLREYLKLSVNAGDTCRTKSLSKCKVIIEPLRVSQEDIDALGAMIYPGLPWSQGLDFLKPEVFLTTNRVKYCYSAKRSFRGVAPIQQHITNGTSLPVPMELEQVVLFLGYNARQIGSGDTLDPFRVRSGTVVYVNDDILCTDHWFQSHNAQPEYNMVSYMKGEMVIGEHIVHPQRT